VTEREFLDRVFSHVDVKGTRLVAPGAATR
jgi:hypothetical protein